MNVKSIVVLFLTLGILTACVQSTTPGAYPPPGTTASTPTASANYPPPTGIPTSAAPTPTHIPVDIPPIQRTGMEAISKKYNLPIDQIHVVSSEAVTWPNGCLGVMTPGVMCTQALVPGFRIILEANGEQYEIHTNQDGTTVVDASNALTSVKLVVLTADRTVQVIDPKIAITPTYNPAFNGFLSTGGSILGTAYVLDFPQVLAIDAAGQHDLTFIQDPTYGLAVWRGGLGTQPLLAWGTQAVNADRTTSLQISNLDGSNLETLLTISAGTAAPVQLVAEFWSSDGQSLYFSKEPVGIGGYIPYPGASNLYKIDIKSKEVTDIIPQASGSSPQVCLDAISGDYRYVADHCAQNVITIRDLQTARTATIQPPADVTGYRLMGSARFSPAGDRVAFALAEGNPDNEHSWVAVANSTGGLAKSVLTGQAGGYYNVLGWLNDQTLLVQYISSGSPAGTNQVFMVGADGSNLVKVADGTLFTVIDNR